jgi:hypothetical protein
MSYWYMATPYSRYPDGIDEAYKQACRQTAILFEALIPVFCPIAHCHGVAIFGGMDPLDHTIWMPADKPLMAAARGLIVCMLEGWETSYGVAEEIKYFLHANKKIVYMEPGQVPDVLVLMRDGIA